MASNEALPLAARVRCVVDRIGVAATARALGVSREAVARVVGGLDVQRGTIALVEREISRLEASAINGLDRAML